MQLQRFSNGRIIILGAEIAGGGEGKIYEVDGETSLVAKIYHQGKNTNTEKLKVMSANPPQDPAKAQNHISIAWAVDLLSEANTQEIVGFLMGKASKMRPIHSFYSPKNRRQHIPGFNYLYLHRTARNLASAISALHASNYVIGDVNESNILVAETALITLVDTDSFQVRDPQNGKIYRCLVGKAEFTPPELQGKNFRDIDRNLSHDLFGLGVLIFQLLMEGTHPFEGIFQGTGEPPAKEKRIAAGHFSYGQNVPYVPKPFAPSFNTLSPSLQKLFTQCFVDGHKDPTARPDTQTWVKAIEEAEHNLITCNNNQNHLYGNHLNVCPWCQRTVKLKGRDPFPRQQAVKHQQIPLKSPTTPSVASKTSNLSAPQLTTLLNNFQQALSTYAKKGKLFYSSHKKIVRLSAAGLISLSAIAFSVNSAVQKAERARILEQERQAAIQAENERKERERARQAAIQEEERRQEAARAAKAENERKERERLAAIEAERRRQAAIRAEAERKERERLAAKAEAERKEKERLAKIIAEQKRQKQAAIAAQRKREQQRQAVIAVERQRQAKIKAERERQAAIQAQKARNKAIQAERQRQAAARAQKQKQLSSPATQHNTGANRTSNRYKPWELPVIKSNSEDLEDIIRRGK